jgi:hypothetical protein
MLNRTIITAADSLDRLSRSFRNARARSDREPWGTISVELSAPGAGTNRHAGVALVDRRQFADLISDEPRAFKVEPGHHQVTVFLARRARIRGIGIKNVSRTIFVGPAENIRLVCRPNEEFQQRWQPRLALIRCWTILIFATTILLATGVWVSFPLMREAVAWATLTLGLGEPWLSLVYVPFSSRFILVGCAVDTWIICLTMGLSVYVGRGRRTLKAQGIAPYVIDEIPAASGELPPIRLAPRAGKVDQ